jgi:hypothetical protein
MLPLCSRIFWPPNALLLILSASASVCGIMRIYYLAEMLHSDDDMYYVAYIGLWDVGELTSGFLIVGIPSIPKAFSALPRLPESVRSLLRTLTRTRQSSATGETGGSGGERSWRPRRTPRGPYEAADIDTHELVSVKSVSAGESLH